MSIIPLIMCCPPPAATHRTEPTPAFADEVPLRNLMFISDGHVRFAGYEEGYAEGRRTILSLIEASAQGQFRLNSIVTPLFSQKNIEGRSEKLLKHVCEELVRLHADYRRGRVLQNVRVRCYGDLDRLKSMGGFAERVAHHIEMICDSTSFNHSPSVTWWLLAAYGSSALVDIGVDGVIRSGMEEPSTIRLSGLDPYYGAALVGVTDLGPQMTQARFEEELVELRRCRPVLLDAGYSPAFAEDFCMSLAHGAPSPPFTLVLPVLGSSAELAELVRIHAPALVRHGISLDHVTDAATLLSTDKPQTNARRCVLLVSPTNFAAVAARQEADAWLASSSGGAHACRLPHIRIGDANVHLCDSAPAGLVSGLCRAIHLQRVHPQLHGRERSRLHEARAVERRREAEHMKAVLHAIVQDPRSSVEQTAKQWSGAPVEERCLHWDLAAIREMQLAQARGLLPADAKWHKAALGYAYTAVVTAYRAPSDADPLGKAWESTVRFLSPVLMSVACTDEDIFERWEGESAETQWERCCTSERYLARRALGDRYLPVPDVAGWERLLTVANVWETIRAEREPVAHPRVIEGFFKAIAELYAANLRELDSQTRRREVSHVLRGVTRRPPHMGRSLPVRFRARMRRLSLVGAGESEWSEARLELAALNDLRTTRASIAAGIVCRALAMMVPAPMMTMDAVNQHDRVADLMDFRFRLANDLASLTDSIGGDRDQKDNTWTILVPSGVDGRQREEAVARSVATCQDVLERLDVELDRELAVFAVLAPRLAGLVSRSVDFGRRAYSGKHYGNLHLGDLHRMAAATLRPRDA